MLVSKLASTSQEERLENFDISPKTSNLGSESNILIESELLIFDKSLSSQSVKGKLIKFDLTLQARQSHLREWAVLSMSFISLYSSLDVPSHFMTPKRACVTFNC